MGALSGAMLDYSHYTGDKSCMSTNNFYRNLSPVVWNFG